MELLELDKQAHKMIVAWALYMRNSGHLEPAERLALGEDRAGGRPVRVPVPA